MFSHETPISVLPIERPAVDRPAVSVVIPVYNREQLIGRAIMSLLGQDIQEPFEVIVVDDGSTDATCDRVSELQCEYSCLKLIRQVNAGAAVARHRGIQEAKFDIVTFQDSDDVSAPDRLRLLVETFRRFPDCSTVISLSATMSAPSRPNPPTPDLIDGIISNPLEIQLRSGRPLVNGMNIATYKAFAMKASNGRDFYRAANDYDFFLRLASQGVFAVLNKVTLLYEFQELGISQQNGKHYGRTAAYALCAASDAARQRNSNAECQIALREFVERAAPKTLIRLWQSGSRLGLLIKIIGITLVNHRWYSLPGNMMRAFQRHRRSSRN